MWFSKQCLFIVVLIDIFKILYLQSCSRQDPSAISLLATDNNLVEELGQKEDDLDAADD